MQIHYNKGLLFGFILLATHLCLAQSRSELNYKRTEKAARQIVEALLSQHPIIDGHNDFYHSYYDCTGCSGKISDFALDSINKGNSNIPLYRKGHVAGQLYNVYGKDRSLENLIKAFDLMHQMAARYPLDIMIAGTAADMEHAIKSKKIALLPILEGAVLLQDSKEVLRMLYRLGLRSVTFAYRTNNLGDGSDDQPKHYGISALGAEMIQEMNKLGVIIDLSHTSVKTMEAVLKVSKAPVIFSHSNAFSLCKVNRNVPDHVLDALKQNAGIIMINFLPQYISQDHADWLLKAEKDWNMKLKELKDTAATDEYYTKVWLKLNPQPVVTVSDVADHFDYLKTKIGVDHIGIGSDLGDYYEFTTKEMTDVSCFPRLLIELARRGWSKEELVGIAYRNFLRVFKAVEQQKKLLN